HKILVRVLHGAAGVLLRSTGSPAEHFRNEVFEACRGNAMMGLVYLWVRVQAGIDHDPIDKVIDHGGDAVDTAEPLVKAGRISDRHWPLLLFLKAGELNTIASVGRRGSVLRANDLTDILGMLRGRLNRLLTAMSALGH